MTEEDQLAAVRYRSGVWTDMDATAQALQDWRLQPENSHALEVLGLLDVLAQKQALGDEDWTRIRRLAYDLVLARRPGREDIPTLYWEV